MSKLEEQRKKIDEIMIEFRQLMYDGKTNEALDKMKEAFQISNFMLQECNTVLKNVLGKLGCDVTQKETEEAKIPNVVFPKTDYIN